MRRWSTVALLVACAGGVPPGPTTPVPMPAPVVATDPGPQLLGTDRFRMPGPIQRVAFVGDAVVAVSQDGVVRLFDRSSGSPRREYRVEGEVWDAEHFHGALLLSQDDDALHTLDLESGEITSEERPGRLLSALADGRRFFADEKVLIVRDRDGTTRRIELPHRPQTLAAPVGGRFVAVGLPGQGLLFEPGANAPAHGLAAGGNGALALDPQNRWVVVEDPAANLRLGVWSLAGGDRIRELDKPNGNASLLRFSPRGRFLAAIVGDELVVWRTEDWQRTCRQRGLAYVRSLTFADDGSVLAVGGNDNTVRIFGSEGCVEGRLPIGHRGSVEALAWGPDGTLYSGGRFDGQVIAWTPAGEGRVLAELGAILVESVLPTPRGLWALTTEALHPIDGDGAPIDLRGIGRGGTPCAAGLCLVADGALSHWNGGLTRVESLASNLAPAFSADGERLLVRDRNAMVLRKTSDGSELGRFEVGSCLWPDGGAIGPGVVAIFERVREQAESDVVGRVVVRADTDGELLAQLPVERPVDALAFTRGGTLALGTDEGVHLWSPRSGLVTWTRTVGPVWSLAWRDRTLAVGLTDGRIQRFDLLAGEGEPVVSREAMPTDCPESDGVFGFGGLGLIGGGRGDEPDERYFGMFADPHHRPE